MTIIGWLIVLSEIGFWVLIGSGLVIRYLLKKPTLGFILLALTPVIDLILLIATSVDLHRGATASAVHGIAAVYIGVSLAFGKSMIAWADTHFRYYVVKNGDKPIKRHGLEYERHAILGWGRHLVAFIIGAGILMGLIFFVGDVDRTNTLTDFISLWFLILVIDLVILVSYFLFPKKPTDTD